MVVQFLAHVAQQDINQQQVQLHVQAFLIHVMQENIYKKEKQHVLIV
jgi:hypothetical protein